MNKPTEHAAVATDARGSHAHDDGVASWTEAVVEAAIDAIITIDEYGRIEFVNTSVQRMFGYSAEELIGQNISILMPEPHRSLHDAYLQRYRDSGERHIIDTIREVDGRRKNGTTFPIEISVSEVKVGSRRIFTGILHDITARRRTQEEKDRLLRDLNKRNIEMTCLYDVGELLRSSRDMHEICTTLAELIRKGFVDPHLVSGRVYFDGAEFTSGPFSDTEYRLSSEILVQGRKRGEIAVGHLGMPTAGSDTPFLPSEQDLIVGIASVLSSTIERRDAESKVIQASKLASIGELAAGVGHEINNPLNAVINCADILIESLPVGSKERQFAELARSESERIARIVRNLLTFSRQHREHHSPARLKDIVDAVLSLSRKKIEKSFVDLVVDVPEDLPRIKCRSEQLQQVVMNLLINALHALDERYPARDPNKRLQITGSEIDINGRPFLRLTVEDTGTGIAPLHMDRLFDPFFTTKGRDVGTGLGLSVSDGIVKDHGGQIWVESEHGSYARFHVDLPLDREWPSRAAIED